MTTRINKMGFGLYDIYYIGEFDEIPKNITIKGSLCKVNKKNYLYTNEYGWIEVENQLEAFMKNKQCAK